MRRLLIVAAGGVLALGGIVSAVTEDASDSSASKQSGKAATEAPTTTTTEAPMPATTEAPTTTTTTAPPEDPEVSNARRSAESYLEFSGFSRQGLIDQLSSEYGEQFPVEAATVAVDSLSVDWNAEAVEAAESYLEFSGFSHAGLVEQLSSEYGDRFTVAQAEYGAATALGQ